MFTLSFFSLYLVLLPVAVSMGIILPLVAHNSEYTNQDSSSEVYMYLQGDSAKKLSINFIDKLGEFFSENNEEFANYYFNYFEIYQTRIPSVNNAFYINELRKILKDTPKNNENFERFSNDFKDAQLQNIWLFLSDREHKNSGKLLIFSLEEIGLIAQYDFDFLDEIDADEENINYLFFSQKSLQNEHLLQKTNSEIAALIKKALLEININENTAPTEDHDEYHEEASAKAGYALFTSDEHEYYSFYMELFIDCVSPEDGKNIFYNDLHGAQYWWYDIIE